MNHNWPSQQCVLPHFREYIITDIKWQDFLCILSTKTSSILGKLHTLHMLFNCSSEGRKNQDALPSVIHSVAWKVLILTSKKSWGLNTLGYTLPPISCSVVTFEHGEQSVAGGASTQDLWITVTLMPSSYFPWPEPAKFPWMCHVAKADGWDNKLKIYRGLAEQVRILLTTDHTLEVWFHRVHPSNKRQTPTRVAFIPIPASVL